MTWRTDMENAPRDGTLHTSPSGCWQWVPRFAFYRDVPPTTRMPYTPAQETDHE